MKPNRFIGAMLLMVSVLIIFGLFGTATEKPVVVDTPNEISAGGMLNVEDQESLAGLGLGMIIGSLAIVYIGGITYDEYAHIKDD